jgi:hypothetical protein
MREKQLFPLVFKKCVKKILFLTHFGRKNKSVTPNMCHTVSQCDTMTQKSSKMLKKANFCQLKIKIDWTHFDTLDTSLTPKVFKFNGPSKDSRKHRRSTYFFFNEQIATIFTNLYGPLSLRLFVAQPHESSDRDRYEERLHERRVIYQLVDVV